MALQSKVGVPALGFAGQEVVTGQAIYATYNPLSDGTVKAGEFAFGKTTAGNGMDFGTVSATGAGTPIGIVERVVDASIVSALASASPVYGIGFPVTIAIRGQFYAVATGATNAGDAVLCDPATGAITYGAVGSANDTGWIVVIPNGGSSAVAGDVIIYQRY